ncbi:MAG TPA: IS4 family transposase [Longimicrobium sp.]|jgi:hypothetical protein
MARTRMARPEQDLRLTDLFTLGALMKSVPMEQVRKSLARTERGSRRVRDLPAEMMMYYVMALALFRAEETREVLRLVLEGVRTAKRQLKPTEPAGKSGISRARQRLGEAPVRDLYGAVAQPIAVEQTRGAWYRNWRTVALDGTTMETPDTVANAEAFGRPTSSRGESAWPRLRIVGLVETGTHVLFGASVGSYSTGEVTLAKDVIPHLRPGMLCLADRYFPGYDLWKQATATGAHMVWRVRTKVRLPREKELPDGSYLSHMYKRWNRNKPQGEGLPVRVIDYEVSGSTEQYRLVTSILDPEEAPAGELAMLYHERWEFETTLDEFKTHLRGARTVLRSQTPELIRQEVYGLLLAHFALRSVMHDAALQDDRDPDRISFIHTVRVVRRNLPRFAALPPSGLDGAVHGAPGRDPAGGSRAAKSA